MSRLTKALRSAIVDRILNDLPQVDYDSQAQVLVQDDAFESMPDTIKMIYRNPDLRHWLQRSWTSTSWGLSGCYVYSTTEYRKSAAVKEKLDALSKLAEEQSNVRRTLRNKLTVMLDSCSTIKRAIALMPELANYFPKANEVVIDSLPATIKIADELVKAGWKGTLTTGDANV